MNSDPNSDSKQCPESKLSRVYSAPTHGPGYAQAARTLRHVVVRAGSYRDPPPPPGRVAPVPGHVAARTRMLERCVARKAAPCRSPFDRIARLLHRIMAHAQPYHSATACRVAALLHVVSQRYCASCHSLSRDTLSSQAALLSQYKNCIVTQLGLNQDTHALPPPCRDTKPMS